MAQKPKLPKWRRNHSMRLVNALKTYVYERKIARPGADLMTVAAVKIAAKYRSRCTKIERRTRNSMHLKAPRHH